MLNLHLPWAPDEALKLPSPDVWTELASDRLKHRPGRGGSEISFARGVVPPKVDSAPSQLVGFDVILDFF